MKKINWKNLGLIALAVMLVGALAFAVVGDEVFADDGDDPADEPTDELPDFSGFGPGPNHPARERTKNFYRYGKEAMLESIAEQTGIAIEELEATLEDQVKIEDYLSEAGYSDVEVDEILLNAKYAAVDHAVDEGKMTEEEGEEAKAKLAELDDLQEEWAANREAYHQIWFELIAEKTEFTVEEIEEAFEKDINVHKLLEGSYPEEEAHAILEEAWSEMVDQALTEGLITEEQAENLADKAPFSGPGPVEKARGRMTDELKERFGEDWQEELKRRMNPDCDCTCPDDGDT